MRNYSVELAIQELDDKRMLRLRQEVPESRWKKISQGQSAGALVGIGLPPKPRPWNEDKRVARGEDFSLIKWSRALSEVFGAVGLTAAARSSAKKGQAKRQKGSKRLTFSNK